MPKHHSGARNETSLFVMAGLLTPFVGRWLSGLGEVGRQKLSGQLTGIFIALAVPSPNAAQKRAVRLFSAVLFRVMARARKQDNDVVWQWGSDLLADIGKRRAPLWAQQMDIDPQRMDQMAALQDREDELFGVTGHWEVREADHAVKVETACPFAACASGMPELCTEVVHRFEIETFRALNPSYTLEKLEEPVLSSGGEHCRFVHRIVREQGT